MGDLSSHAAPVATTCRNRGTVALAAGYMAAKRYALAAGICMEKLWVREGIVGLRTWYNERKARYGERASGRGPPLTVAGSCR